MTRGDLVTVALAGDAGKPRPALIVQSDMFSDTSGIVVIPLSSTFAQASLARVTINPSDANGLVVPSQIMVDKITALKREKVGRLIGRIDDRTMADVSRSITTFLGLA